MRPFHSGGATVAREKGERAIPSASSQAAGESLTSFETKGEEVPGLLPGRSGTRRLSSGGGGGGRWGGGRGRAAADAQGGAPAGKRAEPSSLP